MEVYNERWRIQQCPSMEKSNSLLRWLWCFWLNSLNSTAFMAILICVLPFVLPILVILSAFVVAFSIPIGFMFAVFTEMSELKSSLLCEHRPPVSFCAEYEDVFSDGRKEEDKFDEEKFKEEGYEQDDDLEEEDLESEDDMRRVIENRIETLEEDNGKIQGKGELGNKAICGQNYDVEEENKYDEEKIKEEGYKQDFDLEEEEKELEDDTRRATEARIELGEESYSKIQEEDDLGREIGGQLSISEASVDFKKVIADHFYQNKDKAMKKYRMKTDGSEEKIKEEGYKQDYDLEEEEKELEDDTRRATETMIELGKVNYSKIQEEDDLGTEIGGELSISEASYDFKEVIADRFGQNKDKAMKKYRKKTDGSEEKDIDIEFDNVERDKLTKQEKRVVKDDDKQVEHENTVFSTRVESPFLSWGSSGSFGNLEQILAPPDKKNADKLQENCDDAGEQFHNVEPGELVRETMHMVESVRNEGKMEIKEATAILPSVSSTINGAFLDLEHVKLLSIEEDSSNNVSRLQTINEQLESKKEKSPEDASTSIRLEIERTSSMTMKFVPQKVEQLKFKGIEIENHTVGMKGGKRDTKKL